MTAVTPVPRAGPSAIHQHLVDITIPVHNEVGVLGNNVRALHRYMEHHFPFDWRITIAENASTDDTWAVARDLTDTLPNVHAIHLDAKGKGRAVRAVWSQSDADVVAFMDADLSTELGALLPLVAPLVSGHSDIAIGSRLAPGARVRRAPTRDFISRGYNVLVRSVLGAHFRDAQCGFKAARAEVAQALLPFVQDDGFFFDTELLVLAQRAGLRVHEVPVDWIEDPDSRVNIRQTALEDLKGIWRLARHRRRLKPEPAIARRAPLPPTTLPLRDAVQRPAGQ